MTGGGPRRCLLAALVALLLSAGLTGGAAGAATRPVAPAPASKAARDPVGEGALAVTITSMSPAVPTEGDTLTVRGTIRNTSAQPVSRVRARLRVSRTALAGRADAAEVMSGQSAQRGAPLAAQGLLAAQLAPGAARTFSLVVDVDDLDLPREGVYVVGAEALGSTGSGVVGQDLDRTLLPWWPDGTSAEPVLLTTLWPLTAPPLRDATGTLLSDELAQQLSTAGRLGRLLAAVAEQPGAATVVVDPAVVQAAADMATGYRVRTEDGRDDGTGDAEVDEWLDDLRAAVTDPGADVAGMLYGWPDLTAVRSGRLLGTYLRQRPAIDRATRQVLDRALPAEVALLPGGVADRRTLRGLAAREVGVTVLSDQAFAADPTAFTASGSVLLPVGSADLRALVADARIAEVLGMPMADEAGRTAARQRLLAETLMTALELPNEQRLLVAAPAPTWDPAPAAARMILDVISDTPWLRPTSLAAARARDPSDLPRVLADYTDDQREAQISAAQVAAVRNQYADLAIYDQILSDGATLATDQATAPARGLSAWWREDGAAGGTLTSAISRQTRRLVNSVRIVSSGSITISGAEGTIPVTVENTGPEPVTVAMTISSDPPQRVQADPVAPFDIDPGRRRSLQFDATVLAAGPIQVDLQLTTAEGDPFGTPGQLTVQSSAYANAAGILVRVALAGLFVAVVVHAVRRTRRRRGPAPAADHHDAARESEVVGG